MNGRQIRKSFVYRHLASIKTTIYLLFILFFFFLIGTIFPQGVDPKQYEEAGGKFLFAAQYLGFLHIFETPLFFLFGFLLALNTLICTFERIRTLDKRTIGGWGTEREGGEPFTLPGGVKFPGLREALEKSLNKRGYKLSGTEESESSETLLFRKGLNLTATSILFHGGIFICLILFFYTHYFAYENFLTIYPGERKEVDLPGGEKAPFALKLNEFKTLYEDNPKIEFPREPHLKIVAVISKAGKMAAFKLEEGAVAVSDWISDISVLKGEKEVARKKIEVNIPLRHVGFTFYQMGYDQEVELLVSGRKTRVSPGDPFQGEKDEKIAISSVKHGELKKLGGKTEKMRSYLYLYRVEENGGKRKREKIGEILLGENKKIAGTDFTFLDFKEGSVLSYRVDPSVNVLYYLSFITIILITVRLYFRQSRLILAVGKGDEEQKVTFLLQTQGGIFSSQRESGKIKEALTDIGLCEKG